MSSPTSPRRTRWFDYFRNPLSVAGLMAMVCAGTFHLGLFLIDASHTVHNPYLNIWFYIVAPPIVFAGLGLALVGAWRMRRQARQGKGKLGGASAALSWKGVAGVGSVTLLLLMPFFGLTSYKGYKYTETVEFCGATCHVPMGPVFTAYQNSPHARVECAACHIGEGASWYVRSKFSGTRQVFATLLDSFERPIDTPIKNLRPARETCERCHWPEKAFGSKVVDLPHYATDEANSRRPLSMILKTGGGDPEQVEVRGIHWHFLASHRTEYVAVDHKRQDIPWVRVTTDKGVRVFRNDGLSADAPPPEGELRVMDCLDCHNRPAHKYRTPDQLANGMLSNGFLDQSLPFVKREAARLMAARYEDTPTAQAAIIEGLHEFYAENYPDIATGRAADVDAAADYIADSFAHNIFPEMRTDWRSHADNIGHKYVLGCFRCHDDEHRTDAGEKISRDCALCHDFLEHEEESGTQVLVRGGYRHPFELGEAHEKLSCNACHDGGPTPPPTCTACHGDVAELMAGTWTGLLDAPADPDPHFGELDCMDCHEGPRGFASDEVFTLCVDCHDEEPFVEAAEAKYHQIEAARKASPGAKVDEALVHVPAIHNLNMAMKALGLTAATNEEESDE